MRIALTILLLLPSLGFAADRTLLPTNRELYENCKDAITTAEAGDSKAFLRTYCAARIDGVLEGVNLMLLSAGFLSEEDEGARKVIEAQTKQFCQLKAPMDENSDFPELRLARLYVSSIDNWKSPVALEKYLEKPAAISPAMAKCPEPKKS